MIINGKSTYNLPFYCVVEELDPPQKAKRKDKLFETEHGTGYMKQTVDAYEPVERKYMFYLHNVQWGDIQMFKDFIADSGWFIPFNEKYRYDYLKSELEFAKLDAVNGYEVDVTFYCQPFAYEDEVSKKLGTKLYNETNAPMQPKFEIRGTSGQPSYLKIGEQTMHFKSLPGVIYIECKHGHQDAWSSGGRKVNNLIKGDFFEVPPGVHEVEKGQGITEVTITERRAWR